MIPTDLLDRIEAALQRHADGRAPRQIPVNRNDSDVVLADLRSWRAGEPMHWAGPLTGERVAEGVR